VRVGSAATAFLTLVDDRRPVGDILDAMARAAPAFGSRETLAEAGGPGT